MHTDADLAHRQGDWIDTAAGPFWPADPRPEDIDIQIIATALANLCRFGGHVTRFYCPTPDQRILTADLRWVPAGDLTVGTPLIGFDEHPVELGAAGKLRRRFRPSIVTAALPVKRSIWRLEMADGSTVRCSAEHPWLVATKQSRNQKWVTTDNLVTALAAGRSRYMHRFMVPWDADTSNAGGWLAGLYDGEGYFSHAGRGGVQLGLAQKPGLVLDRAIELLRLFGFPAVRHSATGSTGSVTTLQLQGGWREALRLLGSIRPIRLLDKFTRAGDAGGMDKQMNGIGAPSEIVAAYPEGEDWVSGLETSSHTYFCEGYGAHNSVAQHSVLCARQAPEDMQLEALLHDAAEAYIGDVVTPLKRGLLTYRAMEARLDHAIGERFRLPFPRSPIVQLIDEQMLVTEAAFLHTGTTGWWRRADQPRPFDITIDPWPPERARFEFLNHYRRLVPDQQPAAA